MAQVTVSSVLPKLRSAVVVDTSADRATVASHLKKLTSSLVIASPTRSASIASHLKKLVSTASVTTDLNAVQAHSHLRALRSHILLRGKVEVSKLTGEIRSTGDGILSFFGPANRAVRWSIIDGAGALAPNQEYTDTFGRASCRYRSNGFVGVVTIQVEYVA